MGFEVEIPRADKMRYFVFQGNGGNYDLIDDFVVPYRPIVTTAVRSGDSLAFLSERDAVVFKRPYRPPSN